MNIVYKIEDSNSIQRFVIQFVGSALCFLTDITLGALANFDSTVDRIVDEMMSQKSYSYSKSSYDDDDDNDESISPNP